PAAGAGAAATYTSYYTYQATGSLNKANKEGAITFATTYAASYVSAANWGVPQTIVAQGVIGGTSAKLQGGSFEKGFMYSAAAAGAMEAYKAALNRVPSDECPKCAGYKPGYGPGEGISDKTPDISLRDPTFNNIGNGAEGAIRTGTQEGSTFSNTLNHVPLMNPMSAMHDSWTTYTPALNINANYGIPFYASIPVAYVVTLAATLSETPNVVVQLAVNDSRK
ncbi:MAG: hypothetical protein ACXU8A_05600, partial [Burkholderiaceae bacterium]